MKAHDVRHLCVCGFCKNIGDDREMLVIDLPAADYGVWKNVTVHGRCAYQKMGARILDLPSDQRAKFTLGDVDTSMMRRLLAKAA